MIPNFVAGKLIGKGGSNINELETKYNASIQVSPNKEFYPGTDERIVTISAEPDQIIEFSKYMIEKVQVSQESDRMFAGFQHEFKIIITNVAVGLVMGKGGSTIKVIQEESNAKINICKQDESSVRGERLLKISGSVEQRLEACTKIIDKMAEEPNKMSNSNQKYGLGVYNNQFNMGQSIASQPSLYRNYQSPQDGARYPMDVGGGIANNYDPSYYEQKSRAKTTFLVQMEIPDAIVGSIVGKQGQTINEFTRMSGAKINFSGKDEFAAGTNDRILTISGGRNQIYNAYMLVDEKVAQVEIEMNGQSFVRR